MGLRVVAAASVGFGMGGFTVNEGVYVSALATITSTQLNANPGDGDHAFILAL